MEGYYQFTVLEELRGKISRPQGRSTRFAFLRKSYHFEKDVGEEDKEHGVLPVFLAVAFL
ncbi:hypothetical protein KY290_027089 [Solanum tuberosum]|uniref:Uncharacterized protein n=1 Tax=Solanum tuberosum TaxID=4113 RepID=A0ABQ7UE26_SOLTU|nr:hypothetical protein KY284_026052 [Solanum tuberosum]KAH0664733.1 hypothetical protein KY285_025939 [Solanum tuberosum]KAH0747857.1 hypothetical protein KY290_027089 [Solanum tuberosum]